MSNLRNNINFNVAMGLDVASIKLLTLDIVKAVLVRALYGRNIPILTRISQQELPTIVYGKPCPNG